jgi:Leucine-rich repeat (LRR) protein
MLGMLLLAFSSSFCAIAQTAKQASKAKQTAKSKQIVRVFDLPANSIGTVCTVVVRDELSDWTPVCAAAGRVKVTMAADQWLILDLNHRVADHPELINAIPPNSFEGLKVGFMSMDEDAPSMSDTIIRKLDHLPNLKSLMLERSDATDKSLMALKMMPHLERMNGSMSELKGAFLQYPETYPELQSLTLFNCQIDSKYLGSLSKLAKLQVLDLHHSAINEDGMKAIGKCRHLQVLRLSENGRIDDKCLTYLSALKGLKLLELQSTNITANGLKALQPLAPSLVILKVSPGILDAGRLASIKQILPHTNIQAPSRGKTIDSTTEKLWAPLH